MTLPDAMIAIRQTFTEEGLADVHEASTSSHAVAGGAVLRLTVEQSASTPDGPNASYREDRFKLRLAGAPGQEVVVGLTRDYLAPVGLNRTSVLHHLYQIYGNPSSANVPDVAIAPNSAELFWLISPRGGREGAGAQSSADLTCGAGIMNFYDNFDNASDDDGDLLAQLARQRHAGCGLVLQVNYAFDAVHYELYDSGIAESALRQPAETGSDPARRAARAAAEARASEGFRY